jgi:glycosyltransferase involved in cell wall biosynthesis
MKVTILWSHWSGYMDACARALAGRGASLEIFHFVPSSEAPFEHGSFFAYDAKHVAWHPDGAFPMNEFGSAPDILLAASWHIAPYRRLARNLNGRSRRVICLDNQWAGTLRQYAGSLIAPLYIHPLFDMAFVPGSRQRFFARRLGFTDGSIVEGLYSCDQPCFAAQYRRRTERPVSKNFAFVGRLIEAKGIHVLREAWRMYRESERGTWGLHIRGAGPLRNAFDGLEGVSCLPFLQPDQLPETLLDSDILLLPSLFEPWGLVIHEAAATGMPIVCSQACGAGDLFVRHGENGMIVPTGDSVALCHALLEMTVQPEGRLRSMGARSFALAQQRTPATWADAVLSTAGSAAPKTMRTVVRSS